MVMNVPDNGHNDANNLSESFPLMNALMVKQQPLPDYPNVTNESTTMTVSMTFEQSNSEQRKIVEAQRERAAMCI